ncbi:MAG: hypothetical protein LW630_10220 [Saprospiraceae bacterium]|jgi:arsenate reductase|nr:hypothetical protein [Saprospiraceae bacterium]
MHRIYHLSTCDTCRKILQKLPVQGVDLINLREKNISAEDLDFMKSKKGNYESLFNKKAQKWKAMPESDRPVNDQQFRDLILSEYTFLKRPAAIVGSDVFAGNDASTVDELREALS